MIIACIKTNDNWFCREIKQVMKGKVQFPYEEQTWESAFRPRTGLQLHKQGVSCVSHWLTNWTRDEFILTNIISGPEPAELWLKIGEIETFGGHTNWQTRETKLFSKHYFSNTNGQLKGKKPIYYMVRIYISIIQLRGQGYIYLRFQMLIYTFSVGIRPFMTFHDLPWPFLTIPDLSWPFLTFHDLP